MQRICKICVGDEHLKDWIQTEGHRAECSFCGGKVRKTVPLKELAEWIDSVIRERYRPGPDVARFSEESDNPYYEQEGETADWIIGEIAEVEPEIAEAIDDMLSKDEARAVYDGEDEYFGGSVRLVPVGIYPDLSWWDHLEKSLMHERRFFDEDLKKNLDEIFEGINELGNGEAIVTIEPGMPLSAIFRARMAEDAREARKFIKDPEHELGAPPPHLARAGRMNAVGIPVFYAAFSKEVAIAEVRPPVGGLAVIGEFAITERLRILDLTFLARAYHRESYFSPRFDQVAGKVAFLEEFHRRLSRPIQPTMEPLEYLPTQAFAEYVNSVLGFDGIAFRSIQTGAWNEDGDEFEPQKCNVVLFSKAFRENEKDGKREPVFAVKLVRADVFKVQAVQIKYYELSSEDEEYESVNFDPEELARPMPELPSFHLDPTPGPTGENGPAVATDQSSEAKQSGENSATPDSSAGNQVRLPDIDELEKLL